MATSTGKEAPQELRPAESAGGAFAVVRLDLAVVVGALMASFVVTALKWCTVPAGRGRWPHADSALWLHVRVDHGLAFPRRVFRDGRDRCLAVGARRELFLEALERV